MEYFWYIIAAPGAGTGTGLAGLSAATVMAPNLILKPEAIMSAGLGLIRIHDGDYITGMKEMVYMRQTAAWKRRKLQRCPAMTEKMGIISGRRQAPVW